MERENRKKETVLAMQTIVKTLNILPSMPLNYAFN